MMSGTYFPIGISIVVAVSFCFCIFGNEIADPFVMSTAVIYTYIVSVYSNYFLLYLFAINQ